MLAGALVIPQTLLFAESESFARIDARVNAMKDAKTAARNTARNEAHQASLKTAETSKPTVNTAIPPSVLKKVEANSEVVALKNTAKQTQNEIVATKLELTKATTAAQKAELEKKLKTQFEKLKADHMAFRKKLVEEARKEVRKKSNPPTTH